MGPYSRHLHRAISKVGKNGSHQASSIGTSQTPIPSGTMPTLNATTMAGIQVTLRKTALRSNTRSET